MRVYVLEAVLVAASLLLGPCLHYVASEHIASGRYVALPPSGLPMGAPAAPAIPLLLPDEQLDDIQLFPSAECDSTAAVPPESISTTTYDGRDSEITIYAGSRYRGRPKEHHSWEYRVEFSNTGGQPVQLVARHLTIVDALGNLYDEVKGPGADGQAPVIEPGGMWAYSSRVAVATSSGYMEGSFQFEVLTAEAANASLPRSFNSHLRRLALSSSGRDEWVPCREATRPGLLPSTSVRMTERVIVGAKSEHIAGESDGLRKSFHLHLQALHIRTEPLVFEGCRLEWVDQLLQAHVEESTTYDISLPPSRALEMHMKVLLPTEIATASGYLLFSLPSEGGRHIEAAIAPLSASIHGVPAPPLSAQTYVYPQTPKNALTD